jgi:PAS domain S-box-containing protein
MKITPTSKELKMGDDDFIVSKTDLKGKITYSNETFIYFSGYDEVDLIDQPHNIIRHPDMPRSVYRFMWENLQKKQEFFGIIKNLNKSGAYYWTFANVTPSFDEKGDVIGYYSVRRQPSQNIIDILSPIYQQMVDEEAKHDSSQQAMDASISILNNAIANYGLTYNEFIYTHAQ